MTMQTFTLSLSKRELPMDFSFDRLRMKPMERKVCEFP